MKINNNSKEIGFKLKSVRTNKFNESQETFGKRINCSQKTLSNYENNGLNDLDEIIRIEELLGISLLNDERECNEAKKILEYIYFSYINAQHFKIGEKFLTYKTLKEILYDIDDQKLKNILDLLEREKYIKLYIKDYVIFILVDIKGILLLNDIKNENRLFPNNKSASTVTDEILEEESQYYINGEYKKEIENEKLYEKNDNQNSLINEKDFIIKEINEPKNMNSKNYTISVSKKINKITNINDDNLVLFLGNDVYDEIKLNNMISSRSSIIYFDNNYSFLTKYGEELRNNGFNIKLLNFYDSEYSYHYNPLKYLENDSDVFNLVNDILNNTKGIDSVDEDIESILLSSLILYLKDNPDIPKDCKNFTNVMKLLRAAEVNENDPNAQSPLDKLFAKVEAKNPNSLAVKQYKTFKMGAGKTLKSVISSCMERLKVFNIKHFEEITINDDVNLDSLFTNKTALFIICSIYETGYNLIKIILQNQIIRMIEKNIFKTFEDYCILYNDEILEILKKEEIEKKRVLIENSRIRKQIMNELEIFDIKESSKIFRTMNEVEEFKEKVKKGKIQLLTKDLLYNVSIYDNFPKEIRGINYISEQIKLSNQKYCLQVSSLSEFNYKYENDLKNIIYNFDSIYAKSSDEFFKEYFNVDNTMEKDFVQKKQTNFTLFNMKNKDKAIYSFDYKTDLVFPHLLLGNLTDFNLQEIDKGLKAYVGQAKTLDQTFKEVNAKTVQDVINRIVLKKSNADVNEGENILTGEKEFIYNIE